MPVYEYRCERGHAFDAIQRMVDDPLTACTTCEAPVQRVFRPPAVHFKGSGFYATDYGRAKSSGNSDSSSSSDGKSDSDSSASSGGEGGKGDSKKGSASESASKAGSGSSTAKASSGAGSD